MKQLRKFQYVVGLICLAILSACGGNGGRGSSSEGNEGGNAGGNNPPPVPANFSLSHDHLGFALDSEGNTSFYYTVEGSLREPGSGFYMYVDSSNTPIIADIEAEVDVETLTGSLNIYGEIGMVLPPGTHTGYITVEACVDPACNEHYDGSPARIDVVGTVMSRDDFDLSCGHIDGNIFVNCVDPDWMGILGWEQAGSNVGEHYEYLEGGNGFLIDWNIVDTGEEGYNQVVEVEFSDSEVNGNLRFRSRGVYRVDSVDLSEFAGGTLEFDLRVIDWADADYLEVQSECFWPCASPITRVPRFNENEWQHFTINVDDLIVPGNGRPGLDLSQVELGFVISPQWGEMQNVHFQLDNIRWLRAQ